MCMKACVGLICRDWPPVKFCTPIGGSISPLSAPNCCCLQLVSSVSYAASSPGWKPKALRDYRRSTYSITQVLCKVLCIILEHLLKQTSYLIYSHRLNMRSRLYVELLQNNT